MTTAQKFRALIAGYTPENARDYWRQVREYHADRRNNHGEKRGLHRIIALEHAAMLEVERMVSAPPIGGA